jgi:GNAT superfamily N-acetyltransferase
MAEAGTMSTTAPGQVRRARPADAAGITAVHVRSWQGAYRGLLPQDYLDRLDPADPDRVDWRRRDLDQAGWTAGGTLVAVSDGRVAGFAHTGPTRDDDDAADPARVGEVYAIYVLPEAWGTGLGRELMAAAAGELAAAGFESAALWVLESNARARRFYELAGWTADGSSKQADVAGATVTEVRYRRALP